VFAVTPAEHGERALEVVDAQQVDAILTDLQMPVMDGLTLLSHLFERDVHVPVAVMTGQQITPELHQRLQQFGIAASFTKPIEIAVLADELQRSLSPKTVGRLAGVTIFGFLQLLEVERKTVLIAVRSAGEEGRLYFDAGALVHAENRWSRGLDAVYEIIGWPDPHLEVFYQRTSRERTIQDPLQHVLMEGARLLDESNRTSPHGSLASPPVPLSANAERGDLVRRAPVTSPAIKAVLEDVMDIDGVLRVALVDSTTGKIIDAAGTESVPNFELFCTGAAELVTASPPASKMDDILVTLGRQYHVVRLLRTQPTLFLYVVLDRKRAILGMARLRIAALSRRDV
jgi:CheY-like chemotaxis protein